MASKKQRRTEEVKYKKTRKKRRFLLLSVIVVASIVFLSVFFITLFDYLYPPAGKQSAGRKKEKVEVTLFFSDANERFLVPEKRLIPKEQEAQHQAREVVNALLAGSKTGLVNTFPAKVELRDVHLEGNDLIVVDFQEKLVADHPGGSAAELATIYSLTNTLTANLPSIKRVKILVGGKERETLKGHISLGKPFTEKRDMVAPTAPTKKG